MGLNGPLCLYTSIAKEKGEKNVVNKNIKLRRRLVLTLVWIFKLLEIQLAQLNMNEI